MNHYSYLAYNQKNKSTRTNNKTQKPPSSARSVRSSMPPMFIFSCLTSLTTMVWICQMLWRERTYWEIDNDPEQQNGQMLLKNIKKWKMWRIREWIECNGVYMTHRKMCVSHYWDFKNSPLKTWSRLCDFLKTYYVREQVKFVTELGGHKISLQRWGPGSHLISTQGEIVKPRAQT